MYVVSYRGYHQQSSWLVPGTDSRGTVYPRVTVFDHIDLFLSELEEHWLNNKQNIVEEYFLPRWGF